MKRAWLVCAALSASTVMGCGDDAAGSVALEDVPQQYARAICDAVLGCYGPAAPKDLTDADCLTTNVAAIQDGDFQHIEQAVAAGRISYNGDLVPACLSAVRGSSCTALSAEGAPPACEAVFVGTIEEGELCGLDEECVSGTFCRMTSACPGTCTAKGGNGDSCDPGEDGDQCESGLSCSAGVCRAPSEAGEACGSGSGLECALGFACQGESATEAGTCVAFDDVFAAAAGEDCMISDTELALCVEGQVCAATRSGLMVTFACEAPVAAGAACKFAVPDQCPAGQYCDVDPQGGILTGTCAPLPAAGEPCGRGGQCASRNECDVSEGTGTCQPVNRIGGACSSGLFCASGICDDGECVAPALCDPSI